MGSFFVTLNSYYITNYLQNADFNVLSNVAPLLMLSSLFLSLNFFLKKNSRSSVLNACSPWFSYLKLLTKMKRLKIVLLPLWLS